MTIPDRELDAIVIGSGPAGATVARELSLRGRRVLILERGGDGPVREGWMGAVSVLNAVPVGEHLTVPRAFTTGGTTAMYFAAAVPYTIDAFLPFGLDLSRELEEARAELPLAELPDELLPPQSLRLRESATALGYPWPKSPMLIDQGKCAGRYNPQAKWTARAHVDDAVRHGAVLVNRARATRVLVENGRAVGVEYRVQKTKKTTEVREARARKVIVAAGGVSTPILLRRSGIAEVADRGFYCHPGFMVVGTISGLANARDGFGGTMGTIIEGDIHIGDGNFARPIQRMIMLANRRWLRALLPSNNIAIGVMVRDGSSGELRADGTYFKQLTAEELRKLDRGEEVAREILRRAGAKRLFKTDVSASHLGGTVRINEHVDADLQTKVRDLHVCDGSVLPEFVNTPVLALICLGKYLARRLAQAS